LRVYGLLTMSSITSTAHATYVPGRQRLIRGSGCPQRIAQANSSSILLASRQSYCVIYFAPAEQSLLLS
jgi:hypothetical protein